MPLSFKGQGVHKEWQNAGARWRYEFLVVWLLTVRLWLVSQSERCGQALLYARSLKRGVIRCMVKELDTDQ